VIQKMADEERSTTNSMESSRQHQKQMMLTKARRTTRQNTSKAGHNASMCKAEATRHQSAMQAKKIARELESTQVQFTKASTPLTLHGKRHPVLNAGSFIDILPDLTPGNCSYLGHAWVVNSYLDPEGRTLMSV
jgi:hypothetical protein